VCCIRTVIKQTVENMAQNHTITIDGIDNGDLVLSDHGHTTVDFDDTVTWVVGGKSGVNEITAITPKQGSENVFNPDPGPMGSGKTWKGTINPTKRGKSEEYTITYTVGSGSVQQFDPIIQVNA
jgi:hypothetical protein